MYRKYNFLLESRGESFITMHGPIKEYVEPYGAQILPEPVGGPAKRAFDVAIALTALIALAPLFLFVILLIWVTDGRPIFIKHKRVGFRGQHFPCLKIRTMVVDAQSALATYLENNPQAREEWQQSQKLKNDPRITPLGRVLRQLSIDELPQLVNVLQGHMSLVGPRPIVDAETQRYGPNLTHYLSARPGLTGLWQISGRSDTSYELRVNLDREYVQTWSMSRDIAIIARTVPAVLKCEGTY